MPELEILENPRDRGASVESLNCTVNFSFSFLKGLNYRLAGPVLFLLVVALLVSCSHWKPRDFDSGLSLHRSEEREKRIYENLAASAPIIRGNGIMQLANTSGAGVRTFVTKSEQRISYV
jgi:hypothetical protein